MSNPRPSQCSRILARLRETPNIRVPMPELARIGSGRGDGFCMVHSRIADLRARGHQIPPAEEHRNNGQCHSFYRILECPRCGQPGPVDANGRCGDCNREREEDAV